MVEETYHGVPRSKLLWGSTIDNEKCTSCRKCLDYLKLGVYEPEGKDGKKEIGCKKPNSCVVFCTGFAEQCPVGAIKFP